MINKLIELGLREEYDKERELNSGLNSRVFWDVEKLYEYPEWVRVNAIGGWIWAIGVVKPKAIIGIKTGGYHLAGDVARCLKIKRVMSEDTLHPSVLIDDVLTTGKTIRQWLGFFERAKKEKPEYIAVLVNRSGAETINGIPIISGVVVDKVEV